MGLKAVGLTLALAAASAQAGECREDVEERLAELHAGFDDQVEGLRIWSWAWGSAYAVAAITEFSVAASLDTMNPSRVDLFFGGASSVFGAVSLYLLPMRFTRPLSHVRWDDPDRCRLLADAEAVRLHVAADQRLAKGWVAHIGNVVFNTAVLLMLGVGFGHWQAGLISAAIGVAVGELNLLSQPTKMWRYAEPPPVHVIPILTASMQGVGLVGRF